MRFGLVKKDRPGALQTRMDTRLAYITEMAGPILDGDEQMCGSLIVLEVADMEAAQTWADNDPYAKAGLFSNVTFRAWKKVID